MTINWASSLIFCIFSLRTFCFSSSSSAFLTAIAFCLANSSAFSFANAFLRALSSLAFLAAIAFCLANFSAFFLASAFLRAASSLAFLVAKAFCLASSSFCFTFSCLAISSFANFSAKALIFDSSLESYDFEDFIHSWLF